jgi:WD40 repeat protein
MKQNAYWLCLVLMALILAACTQKTNGSPASGLPAENGAPTEGAPVQGGYSFVTPDTVALCKAAFSASITDGAALVPVRTLVSKTYEGGEWQHDPNVMAFPHWEPMQASVRINSLLCLVEDRTQKKTYADGREGYQVKWDARLVQYPSGTVIKAQTFEGDEPPSDEDWESMKGYTTGPAYGDPPDGKLLEWACPSFGDSTIFCNGVSVFDIALSPDGNTLAIGGYNNIVTLWDVNTGQTLRTLTLSADTGSVNPVTFSPDGKYLAFPGAIADMNQPIRLWDIATKDGLIKFSSEGYLNANALAFSPDGKLLASGDWDGTVYLWDVSSGKVLRPLKGHTDMILSLAFSPDGKWLASGSYDNSVLLWEAASGQIAQNLKSHTGGVNEVAFSPNGKKIASASDDQTVIVWDTGTGQALLTIHDEESMTSAAFSPDGKTLATAAVVYLKLWDSVTGKLLRELDGHHQSVRKLIFSKDGKSLFTGSIDTTVRKWDLASGK